MTVPHEHAQTRAYAAMLRRAAPHESAAFAEFSAMAVTRGDGAIPPKYRELIALAVALTTQCEYCIASHSAALQSLGADECEIAETTYITAALRAGGAATHGMLALRYFAEAGSAQ